MSIAAILGLVYGAGAFVGLIYVGAKDLKWDNYGVPGPAVAFLIWPLALPVVIGKAIRHAAERRKLAAEEKRKWLEAPLP